MSTHRLPIITITQDMIKPHSGADKLELIMIQGWQVVAQKGIYTPGTRAVYIEPDFMVPTDRACFAFLKQEGRTHHRVRTIRLRKQISFGLLVPMTDFTDSYENLNAINGNGAHHLDEHGVAVRVEPVTETWFNPSDYQIERFVEKVRTQGQFNEASPPAIYIPKFDLESYNNFPDRIIAGEPVIITEKIHGANARYVWHNDRLHIGTRTRWLQPDQNTAWHRAVINTGIEAWCRKRQDVVLFGEVYGNVQSLKYGLGDCSFVAFAAMLEGAWFSVYSEPTAGGLTFDNVRTAPVLYQGPFDLEIAKNLAEGDSSIPTAPKGHMREGVVITPAQERVDVEGRVALKLISTRYWEQK